MTYNNNFKESNYINRLLINKIEIMLMKGNTSYLRTTIFHLSSVGIIYVQLIAHTKSEKEIIFPAETVFLLKIISQQFDFHSIAKEYILKEHAQ